MRYHRLVTIFTFLVIIVPFAHPERDMPTPLVLIESRILEVHQDFMRDIGVDYRFLYTNQDGQKTLEVEALVVDTSVYSKDLEVEIPWSEGTRRKKPRYIVAAPQLIIDVPVGESSRFITLQPDSIDVFLIASGSQGRTNIIVAPVITTIGNQGKACDSVTEASPHEGSYDKSQAYSVDDKGAVSGKSAEESLDQQGRRQALKDAIDGYDNPRLSVGVIGYPSSGGTGSNYDSIYGKRQAIKSYDNPMLSVKRDWYPSVLETDESVARAMKCQFTISRIPDLLGVPRLSIFFKTEIKDTEVGDITVLVTPLAVQEVDWRSFQGLD